MKHITRKWADDSEVTHCTTCGKLFTVTVRKVSTFQKVDKKKKKL